jgi:DNA-binding MarR family transcriptional regulator
MAIQTQQPAPADACAHALGDDLGWGLGVAFRAYVKSATALMARLPGGPRSYQVLTIASRDQPGTQLAIAAQLGVDRTVMTYLLDALEKARLVAREPDPNDRRARRIVVSKRGLALLAELDEQLRDAEAGVLSALDEEERAVFRSLLRRVATHVDAVDPVTDPCTLANS